MKISKVHIQNIKIPLLRPFRTAVREVTHCEQVVVTLEADNGIIGIGCATPTPAISGETMESVSHVIREYYTPKLLKQPVDTYEYLIYSLENSIKGNKSALCAVDMALHDLFARLCQKSVRGLLGGRKLNFATDHTVSLDSPDVMAKHALELKTSGFKSLKIKTGDADPKIDLARIFAVHEAVGDSVTLRIDANQAWTTKSTLHIMREVDKYRIRIDFLEQPLNLHDLAGMAFLKDRLNVPLVADESVYDLNSLRIVLENKCADIVNIKLLKFGGISGAKRAAHLAHAFQIPCLISCMLESRLGLTAATHLACALPNATFFDLDAGHMLVPQKDPFIGGVKIENGDLIFNDELGLGITMPNSEVV